MKCSDVKVTVFPTGNCGGGSDQGGEQTERHKHKRMAATATRHSSPKHSAIPASKDVVRYFHRGAPDSP